jgi:hypothetical protein
MPDHGPVRSSETSVFRPSPSAKTRRGALLDVHLKSRGSVMLDAVVLLLGLGFFALSVGYAIACERL